MFLLYLQIYELISSHILYMIWQDSWHGMYKIWTEM